MLALLLSSLPRYLTSAAVLFLFSLFNACSGQGNSPSTTPPRSATAFYVDCPAANNGSGTQTSPWNSLSSANSFAFIPGDSLLFNRGTTCNGALTPQGSGSSTASIVIDAYGTGAQPVINGGTAEEAVKLFNQQYWEINNLEITGGNLYGVYVSGDAPIPASITFTSRT